MPTVISFDLDDALYDNSPVIAKAEECSATYLITQFKMQNRNYDFDYYISLRKKLLASDKRCFENLSYLRQTALKEFCTELDKAEEIANKAFELFMDARCQVTISNEIENMLEALSKKYILVSVSNGNCEMSRLSISKHFSKNYSAVQGFRAKPHPQMLLEVLKDFELDSRQLLHVGDSIENDGGAAINANVGFFHFAPFEHQNDIQQSCDLLKRYLLSN